MDTITVILFITLVVRFVIGAWRAGGRLSAPDRWSLITSCAVAITTFVVAPLLINWVIVPAAIWFVAVALFATGVVGAVLRWPELVWTIGTHPFRQAIVAGVTLVSCTLIIGATMI